MLHFMEIHGHVMKIQQVFFRTLMRDIFDLLVHVLVDPGQLCGKSTVLVLQLIPYILVLHHLLVPLVVDCCYDVVVNLVDSLHDLVHLFLKLL